MTVALNIDSSKIDRMRSTYLTSLFVTLFLVGCGGDDGSTATTTDGDTGATAEDTSSSSTDTGSSTDDTGSTTEDTGTASETSADTMMASDSTMTTDTMMVADTKSDAPTTGATFTQVYAIITSRCSPCHTGGSSGNLDMTSKMKAYMNLVGKKAGGMACASGGMTRVVAGNPDNSLMYWKITKADADV